jgi:hypothetical protein
LKLLTHHGKTLETRSFQCSTPELPENVLEILNRFVEGLELCTGVPSNTNRNNDHLMMHEWLNDTIVQRSVNCKFTLQRQNEGNLYCEECMKLMSAIKVEDQEYYWHDAAPDAAEEQEWDYGSDANEDLLTPTVKLEVPGEEKAKKRKYKKRGSIKQEEGGGGEGGGRGGGEPKMIPLMGGKPKMTLNRVKCDICLKIYKCGAFYKDHLKSHSTAFDIDGFLDCPKCNERTSKMSFTEHFAKNHGPPPDCDQKAVTCCLVCFKVMPAKGDALERHIQTRHQKGPQVRKKTICTECGKVFNSISYLAEHMKNVHSGEKDVFCDKCGKAFGHPNVLQRHKRLACSNESWACSICAKVFMCRRKLKLHIRTHCTERPYACRNCSYKSSSTKNLSTHVKKSHNLRGLTTDFDTLPDVLQRQIQFVDTHLSLMIQEKRVQRPDPGLIEQQMQKAAASQPQRLLF